MAAAEDRLLDALQRDRDEGVRVTPQTWNSLSRVEQLAVRWYLAKDEVRKRRKKKRKKKKLPKVSSHSSCGRARRRQRQYAGHFFPCVSLRHGGRCPCCAGRAGTQVQFLNMCFVPVWLFHRRSSWTGLWYLRRHQHPYRGAEAFPYDKVVHVRIVQVVQSTGAVRVEVCIGFAAWSCILEWTVVDSLLCSSFWFPGRRCSPWRSHRCSFGTRCSCPWCIHRRSSWTWCSCPWTVVRACSQLQLRSPIVMSFTVPWIGCTIDATATVVALVLFVGRHALAARVFASRCRVVVDVSWWCLRFCLGQCEADDWKFSFISSSSGRWVYCMLNGWFSSNDDFCPGSFFFSRFKLKDKRRSAKWEVYLDRAHDHQGGP